jgi:hypothetical protein
MGRVPQQELGTPGQDAVDASELRSPRRGGLPARAAGVDAIALLWDAMRPLVARGGAISCSSKGEHPAGAVARTLHLEFPAIATTWSRLRSSPSGRMGSPRDREREWPPRGRVRRLRPAPDPGAALLRLQDLEPGPGLSAEDVLVVSGGGKGIGAESLWLAKQTGTRVALLGRSVPDQVKRPRASHAGSATASCAPTGEIRAEVCNSL